MPDRESTGDVLVADPGCNRHHGNTAILDLLQPEGLHLFVVMHVLALGEAKGIVSVVTGNTTLLVPLALDCDALEPRGEGEDLGPALDRDHAGGVKGGGSGNIGEGGAGSGGKEPGRV